MDDFKAAALIFSIFRFNVLISLRIRSGVDIGSFNKEESLLNYSNSSSIWHVLYEWPQIMLKIMEN